MAFHCVLSTLGMAERVKANMVQPLFIAALLNLSLFPSEVGITASCWERREKVVLLHMVSERRRQVGRQVPSVLCWGGTGNKAGPSHMVGHSRISELVPPGPDSVATTQSSSVLPVWAAF